MSTAFLEAAENVKNLKSKPTDDEMLELYGLYKQATVGDVNTDCPGFFDMKGKAKWNAWLSRKGLDTENAEKQYVLVVKRLIDIYGL